MTRTGTDEWLVRITVLKNGISVAENIYEYEDEADAMESAFGACQEALNDSTEQHAADIVER